MPRLRSLLSPSLIILLLASMFLPLVEAYVYTLAFEWGADRSDNVMYALKVVHPSSSTDRSAGGFNFTASKDFMLGYVRYTMKKTGLPTAKLFMGLWAVVGGLPVGSPLVNSSVVLAGSLTTMIQWVRFDFASSEYTLTSGNKYALLVYVNSSVIDGSNYVNVYGTTNITGSYGRITYASSTWQVISASYDEQFEVYEATPSGFLEFRFNEGGEFRSNNVTVANGTKLEYINNTLVDFASLPNSSSIVFSSFSWTGTLTGSGSSVVNPYDFLVNGNSTVWCRFDESEVMNRGLIGVFIILAGVMSGAGVYFLAGKRRKPF